MANFSDCLLCDGMADVGCLGRLEGSSPILVASSATFSPSIPLPMEIGIWAEGCCDDIGCLSIELPLPVPLPGIAAWVEGTRSCSFGFSPGRLC